MEWLRLQSSFSTIGIASLEAVHHRSWPFISLERTPKITTYVFLWLFLTNKWMFAFRIDWSVYIIRQGVASQVSDWDLFVRHIIQHLFIERFALFDIEYLLLVLNILTLFLSCNRTWLYSWRTITAVPAERAHFPSESWYFAIILSKSARGAGQIWILFKLSLLNNFLTVFNILFVHVGIVSNFVSIECKGCDLLKLAINIISFVSVPCWIWLTLAIIF